MWCIEMVPQPSHNISLVKLVYELVGFILEIESFENQISCIFIILNKKERKDILLQTIESIILCYVQVVYEFIGLFATRH